ncbi:MAG: (Na+)-NQR maturation NqrM [Gammaproteobacteria bacterium]|nr:(Na+)-NQR maturation NqrM [Gammaproteobacteria bacterium]
MTVVFAFGLMLIVVAMMAVGVMFGRKPISGSCGGLKTVGISADCEICGGDLQRCETSTDRGRVSGAGRPAMRDL